MKKGPCSEQQDRLVDAIFGTQSISAYRYLGQIVTDAVDIRLQQDDLIVTGYEQIRFGINAVEGRTLPERSADQKQTR
ncbi:hypothetical protein Thi970DRAFT_02224 [Thiorhodovibrio frisius]|uniref:Uncharacterized protein n=1 Tax=Thiorhodovibrio frisius TaxID=631362 RepID=H8YZ60_9GAMM|nr:hypothetical protein Thi970DRAFT_02224 [Thiorhodovibrio frisius]WPL24276.1 hypothetical protein Thiofri_04493 [Thiorhodovibrio frisius]